MVTGSNNRSIQILFRLVIGSTSALSVAHEFSARSIFAGSATTVLTVTVQLTISDGAAHNRQLPQELSEPFVRLYVLGQNAVSILMRREDNEMNLHSAI